MSVHSWPGRARHRSIACVAAIVTAGSSATPAQAQGAPAEQAVRELSDALKTAAAEATADTTQARPGRLRFTYEVDRRDDCRVRLTQRARVWKAETRLISDADLSSRAL